MVSILIADEYEVVRHGLRIHLEVQRGWHVVAEAADGKEAIQAAIETKPNVAILSYELPLINGVDVTARLRELLPNTGIIAFASSKVEHLMGYFLKAGARGIVFKSEPIRNLIEAVTTVGARKPYLGEAATLQRKLDKPNETGLSLTLRERSVVQLVAQGFTNKQAARTLGIGLKTVETHRLNVMNKLELSTSADLVRYAVRNQIIEA